MVSLQADEWFVVGFFPQELVKFIGEVGASGSEQSTSKDIRGIVYANVHAGIAYAGGPNIRGDSYIPFGVHECK